MEKYIETYERLKFKQFNLQDKLDIVTCLSRGFNLTDTAKFIHSTPSTVKREIDRNKVLHLAGKVKNLCGKKLMCSKYNLCNSKCTHLCADCKYPNINCNSFCKDFSREPICKNLKKHCGVCNGCPNKKVCKLNKWYYDPQASDKNHKANLSAAHQRLSISSQEALRISNLIKPYIDRNISLAVIKNKLGDQLPYSVQSLYNWIDKRILPDIITAMLPRKVRYKQRKKYVPQPEFNRDYLNGRYYDDFLNYITEHPHDEVVEMDTVEGPAKSSFILTLLFRKSNFMLAFKLKDHSANSVIKVFDTIKFKLGSNVFKSSFKVILTDRGTEFSNPLALELDKATGEVLTHVFFCDSRQSQQKGKIEKNHEELRKIFPKGFDFNLIEQDSLNLALNHINSYPRDSLNFKSPFEIFQVCNNNNILKLIDSKFVNLEDIHLSTSLLKK